MLYVDDMCIESERMDDIKRLQAQLAKTFEIKDLGGEKKIFGI